MRLLITTSPSYVVRGLALNRAIADAEQLPAGTYTYDFFGWQAYERKMTVITITVQS